MIDSKPTRNLALELVRVTEAAALAAGRYVGRGDKVAADRAAVDAMRLVLNTIQMDGVIVIGEGEKDEAPMLYNGERLGTGEPPQVDIAVDPIDGTRPTAYGLPNAIATVALAPRGTMFNPGPIVYMDKIAVGPEARDVIDIEAPVEDNLRKIARAKGGNVEDLRQRLERGKPLTGILPALGKVRRPALLALQGPARELELRHGRHAGRGQVGGFAEGSAARPDVDRKGCTPQGFPARVARFFFIHGQLFEQLRQVRARIPLELGQHGANQIEGRFRGVPLDEEIAERNGLAEIA